MVRSTASFISYDLRPAKQAERRLLIDLLSIAGDCGLPITTYRYVGMGGNRFYDFLLIHRYLGITHMTSIEHDPAMYQRACFNVPYLFIDVVNSSAEQFITDDQCDLPTIYWLDYDGGIGRDVVTDISALALNMTIGDFCFVTVPGTPPKALSKLSGASRLNWFREEMPNYSTALESDDVENSQFHAAVHKLLIAGFGYAFATAVDGSFVPVLQVQYKDTTPMVSVGGALLSEGQQDELWKRVARQLPFLGTDQPLLYQIRSLHLTEKERVVFDRAVTARRRRSANHNKLDALGFSDEDLHVYKDLLRYLPHYVETIV